LAPYADAAIQGRRTIGSGPIAVNGHQRGDP
jgi:hypothetical protein